MGYLLLSQKLYVQYDIRIVDYWNKFALNIIISALIPAKSQQSKSDEAAMALVCKNTLGYVPIGNGTYTSDYLRQQTFNFISKLSCNLYMHCSLYLSVCGSLIYKITLKFYIYCIAYDTWVFALFCIVFCSFI